MTVTYWQFLPTDNKYRLEKIGETKNLDDASGLLASGVYTTFRTYEHDKALRLEDHFDRLEKSAALQNKPLTVERFLLREVLREVIAYFSGDMRLRIHCAYEVDRYAIYIMGEPFSPIPEEIYLSGVSVRSLDLSRENPISKATSFIEKTRAIRAAKPVEIHEYIMVDNDRNLLEGLTCNIFLIRNGKVWTAEKGVLPGITRQVVMEVIAGSGIEIVYAGYPVGEISLVEEAFITSASRGVLPVTRFDDQTIGTGLPGQITTKIRSNYEKCLQSELRPV